MKVTRQLLPSFSIAAVIVATASLLEFATPGAAHYRLGQEIDISTVATGAQLDAGAGTEGPLRHAETIAKLESWLRTLQQQRRDSPTSKTSDSDP